MRRKSVLGRIGILLSNGSSEIDSERQVQMKGRGLFVRVRFALAGIAHTLQQEASFQMQAIAGVGVLLAALILKPPLVWLALLAIMVVLVLAAELFNTALEETLDGLHPANAEFVRRAKDCAAGAVLLMSIGSVIVFVLMLVDMKW
jgi:undecaprenol kinase